MPTPNEIILLAVRDLLNAATSNAGVASALGACTLPDNSANIQVVGVDHNANIDLLCRVVAYTLHYAARCRLTTQNPNLDECKEAFSIYFSLIEHYLNDYIEAARKTILQKYTQEGKA